MPRKPNVVPTSYLNVGIPSNLRVRLDAILYSEVENRVPFGAYQSFFSSLLRAFFETEELDLAPYLGTEPGANVVRGRPYVIDQLRRTLETKLARIG